MIGALVSARYRGERPGVAPLVVAALCGTVRNTGQIQRRTVPSLDAQNCDAWGRARVARGRRVMQREEQHAAR